MKKLAIITLVLLTSLTTFSQENNNDTLNDQTSKNELKLNMLNLIAFKWFDASYERLINEESSYGVGLLLPLDDSFQDYRTFSLTPYYRHFFTNKFAEGFFVEAFTMINSAKGSFYTTNDGSGTYYEEKFTDLAVGISLGYKVVSKRGFTAEVYGGAGRNMLGNSDREVVRRGGVSIGYRFN